MRNKEKNNFLSLILLLVLIAALALTIVGCDDSKKEDGSVTTAQTTVATTADEEGTTASTTAEATTADPYLRGEGATEFIFKVVTKSGEEKTFTVRTDKTIVGEALQDVGLIEGEDSQYGLFVKVVDGERVEWDTDGERVEWDTDGKYWAFYVDGVYAVRGVDSTEIEAGKIYCFKAE